MAPTSVRCGRTEREWFYVLMNPEDHYADLPMARALAQSYLDEAAERLTTPSGVAPSLRAFPWSPLAFAERLEAVYAEDMHAGKRYRAVDDPVYRSRQCVLERLRQRAPFHQTDGCWLRGCAGLVSGPLSSTDAILLRILFEELGEGVASQNHATLYTSMLAAWGITLPPVASHAYADDRRFLDAAFALPVFQLAISLFPRGFLPEILGMTLYLEWTVPSCLPMIKRMRRFGLDPLFFRVHLGTDNVDTGHGRLAREAVVQYLDEVGRTHGGADAVEHVWRRIWTGYVAFATTGTLDEELDRLLPAGLWPPADTVAPAPGTTLPAAELEQRLVALIESRTAHARDLHEHHYVGGQPLVQLFDRPRALLAALVRSGQIVPGRPDQSSFFRHLQPTGGMYKVFTPDECALWSAWVAAMAPATLPDHANAPEPSTTDKDADADAKSSSDFLTAALSSTELQADAVSPRPICRSDLPTRGSRRSWWRWLGSDES